MRIPVTMQLVALMLALIAVTAYFVATHGPWPDEQRAQRMALRLALLAIVAAFAAYYL
jgi:hypothetical protein